MNRYITFIAMLPVLFVSACTDQSPLVPETDLVVMQAYLFAGQSVTEIRLTSQLPLGSNDSLAPAISDASVYLTRNDTRYALEPTPDREGYYHYPGTDLAVNPGDEFLLEVDYYGRVASANTTVPEAPVAVSASPSQLEVTSFSMGGGGGWWERGDTSQAAVEVTWSNPDGESFYVTMENTEVDPEAIVDFDIDIPFSRPQRFVSIPVNNSEYRITRGSVTHFGRHVVRVYHVNREYVDLYLSRNQDTRELNEPLTNVDNGLGIFTAFNSDSTVIEVVEAE